MSNTTRFTLELLQSAAKEGIRFGVVRGVETRDSPPGDADVVSPDRVAFSEFISNYCSRTDTLMLPKISRHYVDIYRLLAKSADGNYFTAKIDVHNGEQWRGVTYLEALDATDTVQIVDEIPRLADVNAVIANLMQLSLPCGVVTQSRSVRIDSSYKNLSEREREKLQTFFDTIGSPSTMEYLDSQNYQGAAQYLFRRRKSIWFNLFRRRPTKTLNDLYRTAWSKILCFLRPPGLFFSIIGPDGAGKSTLIAALEQTLGVWTAKDLMIIQHWRPSYLRPLAAFRRQEVPLTQDASSDGLSQGGEELSKPSLFSSLLRYTYYIADYTLGYWLRTRGILVKEGIVICDRYVEDYMIASAERSRVSLSQSLKASIAIIVPRPAAQFYLRGDPELLYSRKKEETLNELRILVREYDAYCDAVGTFVVLDAEETVENIQNSVLRSLV